MLVVAEILLTSTSRRHFAWGLCVWPDEHKLRQYAEQLLNEKVQKLQKEKLAAQREVQKQAEASAQAAKARLASAEEQLAKEKASRQQAEADLEAEKALVMQEHQDGQELQKRLAAVRVGSGALGGLRSSQFCSWCATNTDCSVSNKAQECGAGGSGQGASAAARCCRG